MAFDLQACWVKALEAPKPPATSTAAAAADPFAPFAAHADEEKGTPGNSPGRWAQVARLSRDFGVEFDDLQAFLVGKMKEKKKKKERKSAGRGVKTEPPTSTSNDFDIKSNVTDKKHSMCDDFKQRNFADQVNPAWDSKHRFLRFPDSNVILDLNLDNKHGKSDGKGHRGSRAECKRQDGGIDDIFSSSSSPTLPGRGGFGTSETSGSLSGRDSPVLRLPPSFSKSASWKDCLGDLDGEIGKLPDKPDFGFSSDSEDEECNGGSDTTQTEEASEKASVGAASVDTSSMATACTESICADTPSVEHAVSMFTKIMGGSPLEPRRMEKKERVQVIGGSSVLQINAKHSVMRRDIVGKMKQIFYKKSVAAGWKRGRAEEGNLGVNGAGAVKRARAQVPRPLIRDADIRAFASQIVGCPICRGGSHVKEERMMWNNSA